MAELDRCLLPEAALDITGTADGKLFGYLRADIGRLLSLDPKTAKVPSVQSLLSEPAQSYQAVVAWGKGFYFASDRSLYGFDPETATSNLMEKDIGFRIEAAAVSTCAAAAQAAGSSCASGSDTGGAGGSAGSGAGGGEMSGGGECNPERTDSVYLLGLRMELARFEPRAQRLTFLPRLVCPGLEDLGGSVADSIAVDRRGTAWITSFAGGAMEERLFQADLATGACKDTGMQLCPDKNSYRCIGTLAFVAEAAGQETLYASAPVSDSSSALVKIDTKTLAVTHVGDFDAAHPSYRSLTGTSDGRLFGTRYQNDGIRLVEIDPATAQALSDDLAPDVPDEGGAEAGMWGGKAYLANGTMLLGYDPATKSITRIVGDVGFFLADAGASTCAPAGASK